MNNYAEELGLNPWIDIRPLDVKNDIAIIHSWFLLDYAAFWNMQSMTIEEVQQFYSEVQKQSHTEAFVGFYKNRRSFLMECYRPECDEVGKHYQFKPGDIGMHFMVGPPETRVSGFTRDVLRHVMAFLFYEKKASRVVVEPDIRNDKVHRLNAFVGFRYHDIIQLEKKQASLGLCTRESFLHTLEGVITNGSV
jgi:RimJ/RimL family protein N-acetyltransferase